jgi:ankyrin repeat protein
MSLNENALIDIADGVGVTALMKAAQNKYHQIVKLLTTRHASASLRTTNGQTALVFAAESGWLESLTILLDSTQCTSFDALRPYILLLQQLPELHRWKELFRMN